MTTANLLSHVDPELKEYLVKLEDFEMEQVIGQGAYGKVYKAKHIPTGKICAVKKMLIDELEEKDQIDFCREVDVLSKCDNMFLLPFYGWKASIPLLIVTEYIPNGSLFNALRHRKGSPSLTPTQKTIIALGICKGMASLHAKGIIHRDLKSLNILLNKKLLPTICDFGTSRFMSDESKLMTKDVGTPHWMAPESFVSTEYTNKVDVYAFGILMWEMLTETAPFQGKTGVQIALAVCQNQERPAFPENTPRKLMQFISACWHQDPDKRPTFEQAAKAIESKNVMFSGTEPAAIDYIVKEISDDELIRTDIRGDKVPPLRYNQAKFISTSANNRKRTNTLHSTAAVQRPPPSLLLDVGQHGPRVPRYGDVTNFSCRDYQQNFVSCVESLTPATSQGFFKSLLAVFHPTAPVAITEFVVSKLNQIIRSNANYFNLFIQNDLLHHLPINSESSVDSTFEIALFSVTQYPTLIDKAFVHYISPFINEKYADKALRIMYPVVQMFDRLENGWTVADHLIRTSTNFLKSSPLLYLKMLYYLMSNFTQFYNARFEYIYPILSQSISSYNDPSLIVALYSLMCIFYTPKFVFNASVILSHLQNPQTVDITLSFIMKQKAIHLTPDVMNYMLSLLPANQNAFYAILCSCDLSNSGDSLLANGGSWMLDGKMNKEQVARILLVLLIHSELCQTISNLPETPIFISTLMKSGDIKLIEVASSIIAKLATTPIILSSFEQAGCFENYSANAMSFKDNDSIKTCFFMVDSLSRISLIDEFLNLIEYFVRFLSSNNCYTLSALSALCSICKHQKASEIFKTINSGAYLQQLNQIPQYVPYVSLLFSKLQ